MNYPMPPWAAAAFVGARRAYGLSDYPPSEPPLSALAIAECEHSFAVAVWHAACIGLGHANRDAFNRAGAMRRINAARRALHRAADAVAAVRPVEMRRAA